jgi:hypothetical protein
MISESTRSTRAIVTQSDGGRGEDWRLHVGHGTPARRTAHGASRDLDVLRIASLRYRSTAFARPLSLVKRIFLPLDGQTCRETTNPIKPFD